jgi:hypothetical protein
MTARFLALYETPADPEVFDRHYREVLQELAPVRSMIFTVDDA